MSVSKLVLSFATIDGSTMILTYNYVKSSTTANQVKSLVSGIIAAGDIFAETPVLVKSAKIVTSTENAFDLDS